MARDTTANSCTVGLLAIGSELLDGRVLDTNTYWLSQKLQHLGFEVSHKIVCDDAISDITQALAYLCQLEPVAIIICGGIGPTTDDLTRQAVAQFLGQPLELDPTVIELLKELFKARGRPYSSSNEQQAYRPAGSKIIPNLSGTAPGFICLKQLEGRTCSIYSLPGIPTELKHMYQETVEPDLILKNNPTPQTQLVFRIFGCTESGLNERLKPLKLEKEFTVAYAVTFPTIDLVIRTRRVIDTEKLSREVTAAIGEEFIFSQNIEEELAEVVIKQLASKGLSLSCAESCTGGLIGDLLTAVPGSSNVFNGGIISYSNSAKMDLLGVPASTLKKYGAVSSETVKAMASGACKVFGSDLSVSVSGIAGPAGGTPEKPVGTVFIGLAIGNDIEVQQFNFSYDRNRVRRISAFTALNLIRLRLSDK